MNLRDFLKSPDERGWRNEHRAVHYELKMRQATTLTDYQFYRAAWHAVTGIDIERCPVLFTMGGAFKERAATSAKERAVTSAKERNNDAPVPSYGGRA